MDIFSEKERKAYIRAYQTSKDKCLQAAFNESVYKNKLVDANTPAAEYYEAQYCTTQEIYASLNREFKFGEIGVLPVGDIYEDIKSFLKNIENKLYDEYNVCIGYFE